MKGGKFMSNEFIAGGTWFDTAVADTWEADRELLLQENSEVARLGLFDTGHWIATTGARLLTAQGAGRPPPWVAVTPPSALTGRGIGEIQYSQDDFKGFRQWLVNGFTGTYAVAVLFDNGLIWLASAGVSIWVLEHNSGIYFSSQRRRLHEEGYRAYRFPINSVGRLGGPRASTAKFVVQEEGL